MTDGLVQFLRDRLDEDYEVARLTLGPNVMARVRRGGPAPRWVPSPEGDAGIWDSDGTPRVKFVWARERDHIVRHDPARVLREVEAKRRIIERHSPHSMGECRTCERPHWGVNICDHCERAAPCPDLRDLAAVYADHPDYLPEWRP